MFSACFAPYKFILDIMYIRYTKEYLNSLQRTTIVIGNNGEIVLTIVDLQGGKVRIGIDASKVRFFDKTGTPQYMVEEGIRPINEII